MPNKEVLARLISSLPQNPASLETVLSETWVQGEKLKNVSRTDYHSAKSILLELGLNVDDEFQHDLNAIPRRRNRT
jgi:hypothetical protein